MGNAAAVSPKPPGPEFTTNGIVSPIHPITRPPSGVHAATHSVLIGILRSGTRRLRSRRPNSATTRSLASTNAMTISASPSIRYGRPSTAAYAASSPRGWPPSPSATAITQAPSSDSTVNMRSSFASRGPISVSAATDTERGEGPESVGSSNNMDDIIPDRREGCSRTQQRAEHPKNVDQGLHPTKCEQVLVRRPGCFFAKQPAGSSLSLQCVVGWVVCSVPS